MPNTLVALRLARVLECRVEDLFRLPEQLVRAVPQALTGQSLAAGTRVQLAQVSVHSGKTAPWLAFPLAVQAGWGQVADGVLLGNAQPEEAQLAKTQGHLADVELFSDLTLARRSAVLVGCDPSLGSAASHVVRHSPDVRVLWRSASSLEALRALARGEAHAAGIHLWAASTGVSNLGAVERELPGQKAHLYTLWAWEQRG